MRSNLVAIYWGVCLIALPFFIPWIPVDLELLRDIFFIISAIISVIAFGVESRKSFIPIGIVSLLSVFKIFKFDIDCFYQMIMLNAGLLIYCQLQSCKLNSKFVEYFMASAACLSILWVLLEVNEIEPWRVVTGAKMFFFNGVEWVPSSAVRINGIYANTNQSGAYIALLSLVLFHISPFSLIFSAGALYFLGCTGAWITFLSGLFFYFSCTKCSWKTNRFLLYTMIIGAIGFTLFTDRSGMFGNSGRINAWQAAMDFIGYKGLVLGKGLGWVPSFFSRNYIYEEYARFDKIHNEYFEILINFGIIGLLLFFYFVSKIFKRAHEHPTHYAIVAASLINSTVNFTYHISGIALICLVSYSILTCED